MTCHRCQMRLIQVENQAHRIKVQNHEIAQLERALRLANAHLTPAQREAVRRDLELRVKPRRPAHERAFQS